MLSKLPKPIQYLIWSFQDFSKDNGPQWAAALSYYALMSVFPLLLAALSIAAMFVPVTTAMAEAVNLAMAFLPSGVEEVRSLVESIFASRGTTSIISVALLLWSGSQIFAVARQALNIAFDEDERMGFIKRAVFQLGMALTLGVLLLLAVLSDKVIGVIWAFMLGNRLEFVLGLIQYGVQGLLLFLVFFLAYRFVPQEYVHNRSAFWGALFATVVLLILRPAFNFYVSRFANYSLTYGALATLVILVLWAYLSASIFLVGGQLASLVEGLEYQGKTRGQIEQHHEERAPVKQAKEPGNEAAQRA